MNSPDSKIYNDNKTEMGVKNITTDQHPPSKKVKHATGKFRKKNLNESKSTQKLNPSVSDGDDSEPDSKLSNKTEKRQKKLCGHDGRYIKETGNKNQDHMKAVDSKTLNKDEYDQQKYKDNRNIPNENKKDDDDESNDEPHIEIYSRTKDTIVRNNTTLDHKHFHTDNITKEWSPKCDKQSSLGETFTDRNLEQSVNNVDDDEKTGYKETKILKRLRTADVGTQCGDPGHSFGRDDASYSADQDCMRLYEALHAKQIDRKAINALLAARTISQRLDMTKMYRFRYQKDVVEEVRSKFKGNYGDLCVALLQDQTTQDAELINHSIKGLGTNEDALLHILATRSTQELFKIRERYMELYRRPVEDDVRGDTSGAFQTLCLVKLHRENETVGQSDEYVIEEHARKMWRPEESPTPEHDDVLIEILTSYDEKQFASLCHIYQQITGIRFREAVTISTRGDFRDALLTMASVLEDSVNYHAEAFHKSMQGLRCNDRVVINIFASTTKNTFDEIEKAFKIKYGKSLTHAIESTYSGDFAKLLLKLTEPSLNKEG